MTISYRPVRLEHPEWPSDGQLQYDVRQQLHTALGMDADSIDVSVEHAVVHLEGEIPRAAVDVDVRKVVFRVHGVIGMIDRLHPAMRAASRNAALLVH